MKCPFCDQPYLGYARFCPQCGASIARTNQSSTRQAAADATVRDLPSLTAFSSAAPAMDTTRWTAVALAGVLVLILVIGFFSLRGSGGNAGAGRDPGSYAASPPVAPPPADTRPAHFGTRVSGGSSGSVVTRPPARPSTPTVRLNTGAPASRPQTSTARPTALPAARRAQAPAPAPEPDLPPMHWMVTPRRSEYIPPLPQPPAAQQQRTQRPAAGAWPERQQPVARESWRAPSGEAVDASYPPAQVAPALRPTMGQPNYTATPQGYSMPAGYWTPFGFVPLDGGGTP